MRQSPPFTVGYVQFHGSARFYHGFLKGAILGLFTVYHGFSANIGQYGGRVLPVSGIFDKPISYVLRNDRSRFGLV